MRAVRSFLSVAAAWLFAALIAAGPAFAQDTLMGGAGGYTAASGAAPSGFSISDCSGSDCSQVTFSGSNNITALLSETYASGSDDNKVIRGTQAISGIVAFGINLDSADINSDFGVIILRVGITNSGPSGANLGSGSATTLGYLASGDFKVNFASVGTLDPAASFVNGVPRAGGATGRLIGFVINTSTNKLWATYDAGAHWYGDGNSAATDTPCGTPVGGSPISTVTANGPIYPAVQLNNRFRSGGSGQAADQVTLKTGVNYTLPASASCATVLP